jgi:hypothetical protein
MAEVKQVRNFISANDVVPSLCGGIGLLSGKKSGFRNISLANKP